MAYMCDSEDGANALFLLTRLDEGETLALCGPCYMIYIHEAANQIDAPNEAGEGVADPGQDDGGQPILDPDPAPEADAQPADDGPQPDAGEPEDQPQPVTPATAE